MGAGTKIVGPIYFGNKIDLVIGENCWIGKDISFDGNGSVHRGDNIDIAPHVTISTGGHEIAGSGRRAGSGAKKIIIETGCWICSNVLIINSCVIGQGSIVAAGSVVIGNVDPNTLVAGNPAIKRKEYAPLIIHKA